MYIGTVAKLTALWLVRTDQNQNHTMGKRHLDLFALLGV